MKVKAVVCQEDGILCGSVPALLSCQTWGESYDHRLEMLEDTIQDWLDGSNRQGDVESNLT